MRGVSGSGGSPRGEQLARGAEDGVPGQRLPLLARLDDAGKSFDSPR